MNKKYISYIEWLASLMTLLMYFSYIDQIAMNLHGHKSSFILPVMTVINSLIWISYAMLKPKKDWAIFTCNFTGVIFGLITAITAF